MTLFSLRPYYSVIETHFIKTTFSRYESGISHLIISVQTTLIISEYLKCNDAGYSSYENKNIR